MLSNRSLGPWCTSFETTGASSAIRTSSTIRAAPAMATRSRMNRAQKSCHGDRPTTRSPVSGAVSRCSSASTDDWPIGPVRLLCVGRAGGFYACPPPTRKRTHLFSYASSGPRGLPHQGSIIGRWTDRGGRVFQKEIEIRWRDLDGYAHVNHAVYATYLEEARDEWLGRTVAPAAAGWDDVLVHLPVD